MPLKGLSSVNDEVNSAVVAMASVPQAIPGSSNSKRKGNLDTNNSVANRGLGELLDSQHAQHFLDALEEMAEILKSDLRNQPAGLGGEVMS